MLTPPRTDPLPVSKPAWLIPALIIGLALLTIATFYGVHRFDFVNLDDTEYVVQNRHVNQGLSWGAVAWAFTHAYSCNWHPLTWLSHALDCQIFGLNAGGHHVTNLVLHTLSVLVLFMTLRRMTDAVWRSALVAALFAVHPLHVESVAWVAERKDVLSGLFFMLTLYAYACYAEFRKGGPQNLKQRTFGPDPAGRHSQAATFPRVWYATALLFFALGLMSKPMLVTLPFVLLLLDFWPLGRLNLGERNQNLKPVLVEKIPFFILTAGSCVLTMLAQEGSRVSFASVTIQERFANAALASVTYIRQTVWPSGLAAFYPFPESVPMQDAAWAALLLLGISVALWVARKQWPFALGGWLWFVGMLVPVIGIVQVGTQAHADRYTYLPSIGLFFAITWAGAAWASKRTHGKVLFTVAGTAAVAALSVAAHLQAGHWRDSRALFQHANEVVPNNYVALSQLGVMDLQNGKMEEAMAKLKRALELEPQYPLANNHMGVAMLRQGKPADAIPYLRIAELQPGLRASACLVLALVHMELGDLKEARASLARAEAEMPGEPDIAVVRASLLLREQNPADAEKVYRDVLTAHPEHREARANFANFLLSQNRPEDAEPLFAVAVERDPENVSLRTGLATALSMQGQLDRAVQQMEQARKLAPADPMVQFQSAEILGQAQKAREALACYEKSLELNPRFAGAMNNLAWILATHPEAQVRNGRRAVELAEKACQLTEWKMPMLIGTLAAAYAESGRFDEAIKTAERARDAAKAAHEDALAQRNEELLELYRSGKAYRQTERGD